LTITFDSFKGSIFPQALRLLPHLVIFLFSQERKIEMVTNGNYEKAKKPAAGENQE
jgi:hypothetical protein